MIRISDSVQDQIDKDNAVDDELLIHFDNECEFQITKFLLNADEKDMYQVEIRLSDIILNDEYDINDDLCLIDIKDSHKLMISLVILEMIGAEYMLYILYNLDLEYPHLGIDYSTEFNNYKENLRTDV